MQAIHKAPFEARLLLRHLLRRYDNHTESNILLENHKAVYLFIPKVACSSIKHVCADLFGFPHERVHRNPFPFVRRNELHSRYSDYFRFGFSRNPWDRLVSCYSNKIKDTVATGHKQRVRGIARTFARYGNLFHADMSFEAFVDAVAQIPDRYADPHFRSQSWFFHDDSGHMIADFIGRFETIEQDFRHVAQTISLDAELPHRHISKRQSYQSYYTPSSQAKVAQRYARDIEMLGYRFDEG